MPQQGRTTGPRLTVDEVRTPSACEEFLRCGADDDQDVPLVADDVHAWFRGDHPHVDELTLLLVRDDDGAPVARGVTHRSAELDSALALALGPGPRQLFGAVRATSAAALGMLLDAVERRASSAGATGIVGPVTLLPNQLGGALTGGFDAPGFFDTVWTPPLLQQTLAARGFVPWYPASTWEVPVREVPEPRRRPVTEEELSAAGVRRLPASRLRLRGDAGHVELLRRALNASFAQLPYFTPISRRQMARQTAGLELLLDPDLLVMLAEPSGALASFALVVPDPAPVLRRSGGELGPAQLPDLLLRRRGLRDAVLIVQGTHPDRQGAGLLSLVSRELFAALHRGGWERLRVTFIGQENPASAAVFARAGGRRLHDLAFFQKRLPERSGAEAAGPAQWCRVAARAPSAHNTQPWVPEVLEGRGEDADEAPGAAAGRLLLTVDPARTLPVGDPTHRDLHLSLGAWVESFAVAAAADGMRAQVDDVSGEGPQVRILLSWRPRETGDHDPTDEADVDAVLSRRVHRGRLEPPASLDLPEGFRVLDALDADPLERRAGRHLTSSPALVAELLDWLRLDPRDPRWQEDGLSAECLQLPRAVRTRAVQAGLRAMRPALPAMLGRLPVSLSGAGTGVPVVMEAEDLTPAGLVEAGRRLLRLWLALHRQGLCVSPASEVIDCAQTAARVATGSPPGRRPVAWFRVGVPDDVPPRSARLRA